MVEQIVEAIGAATHPQLFHAKRHKYRRGRAAVNGQEGKSHGPSAWNSDYLGPIIQKTYLKLDVFTSLHHKTSNVETIMLTGILLNQFFTKRANT